MDKFLEMFGGINVGQLILVILFCAIGVAGFLYYKKIKRKIKKDNEVKPLVVMAKPLVKGQVEAGIEEITDHPGRTKPSIEVGIGRYRCFVISESRPDYFTTIQEPVGNVFVAETSMPQSGQCYLVREWADGYVEDYDPRMVEYDDNETPQRAYRAMHWEIAHQVFHVESNFWGKINPWWAVGIIGVFIFIVMIVFGS